MEEQQKNLITELRQGRELAKQLQVHLNVPCSPHESRELLVHKILGSYEKALSLLNYSSSSSGIINGNHENIENGKAGGLAAGEPPLITRIMGIGGRSSEHDQSPRSFSGSPRSEDSDREFLKDPEPKDASRKRKSSSSSTHRWRKQVQISPGGELEGPLDDGYSWRKYGQKDILGATFPRGYYRCTHRLVQGCLATKQVQRSDDDPTILEITYRGEHTCSTLGPHQRLQQPPPAPPGNQRPVHQPPQSHQQTPDMLLNFQTGLKVITDNLDTTTPGQHSFPSFHFGSTSNHDAAGNYSVPPSVILNSDFPAANYSPPFVSSESNIYFSVSPTSNFHAASDCELSEVVSAATSSATTTTTTVGLLGSPFGQMLEFDHNFTFDNPSYFS